MRMNNAKIKRRTAFPLPIKLCGECGCQPIAIEEIEKVEFFVGGLQKNYPGEVTFNGETGNFLFPLSQEETAGFSGSSINTDALVYFKNGMVLGPRIDVVDVSACLVEAENENQG